MIIGLTGPARAGKDTAAKHLALHYGMRWDSFAGPLKVMLQAGLGLGPEELYGDLKESPLTRLGLDKSPRQLLQTLGTEWGRDCVDRDIWLKLAKARYDAPGGGYVVFSDVRFQNEADWVRKHGALIHITRADAPPVSAHSSEGGISVGPLDAVAPNDSTIERLHEVLDYIMVVIGAS